MDRSTHKKKAHEPERRVKKARRQEQGGLPAPAETFQRVSGNVARPSDILALQRTVGNRAVQRMLEANKRPRLETRSEAGSLVQRHRRKTNKLDDRVDGVHDRIDGIVEHAISPHYWAIRKLNGKVFNDNLLRQ